MWWFRAVAGVLRRLFRRTAPWRMSVGTRQVKDCHNRTFFDAGRAARVFCVRRGAQIRCFILVSCSLGCATVRSTPARLPPPLPAAADLPAAAGLQTEPPDRPEVSRHAPPDRPEVSRHEPQHRPQVSRRAPQDPPKDSNGPDLRANRQPSRTALRCPFNRAQKRWTRPFGDARNKTTRRSLLVDGGLCFYAAARR
jgi:hypothetical protein